MAVPDRSVAKAWQRQVQRDLQRLPIRHIASPHHIFVKDVQESETQDNQQNVIPIYRSQRG